MNRLIRGILAIAVLVALIVALRPGAVDQLREMIALRNPGTLTVEMRPDLFDPGATPTELYEPPNQFPPRSFDFAGQTRRFYALPAHTTTTGKALPPLVILLNGSGRDGRAMLDLWQGVTLKGAFLVAPDALDLKHWDLVDDGPDFLAALLDQADAIQKFDRDKVFIYGHSAGANMALKLGNCTDFPARAIAIHAGVLGPCEAYGTTPRAYLIQIGDSDESFPLDSVQASAERIVALGNPVTLQIMPGHNHWIYDIGPALADQAWTFFQTTTSSCSQNC